MHSWKQFWITVYEKSSWIILKFNRFLIWRSLFVNNPVDEHSPSTNLDNWDSNPTDLKWILSPDNSITQNLVTFSLNWIQDRSHLACSIWPLWLPLYVSHQSHDISCICKLNCASLLPFYYVDTTELHRFFPHEHVCYNVEQIDVSCEPNCDEQW